MGSIFLPWLHFPKGCPTLSSKLWQPLFPALRPGLARIPIWCWKEKLVCWQTPATLKGSRNISARWQPMCNCVATWACVEAAKSNQNSISEKWSRVIRACMPWKPAASLTPELFWTGFKDAHRGNCNHERGSAAQPIVDRLYALGFVCGAVRVIEEWPLSPG